jgi:hypothetical protein
MAIARDCEIALRVSGLFLASTSKLVTRSAFLSPQIGRHAQAALTLRRV